MVKKPWRLTRVWLDKNCAWFEIDMDQRPGALDFSWGGIREEIVDRGRESSPSDRNGPRFCVLPGVLC